MSSWDVSPALRQKPEMKFLRQCDCIIMEFQMENDRLKVSFLKKVKVHLNYNRIAISIDRQESYIFFYS